MTGTRDKIRSLFLATLMVTSVFAGTIALSGTAAAATNAQFGSSGATGAGVSGTPGADTTGQTVVAEVDASETTSYDRIEVSVSNFGNAFGSVTNSDVQIYQGGSAVTGKTTVVETSNGGSAITVETDASTDPSPTVDEEISVEIQNVDTPVADEYSATVDIEPQSSGRTATGTLVVGTGADGITARQDNDPTEDQSNRWDERLVSDGGPYWQGQDMVVKVNGEAGTTLQVREVDSTDSGSEIGSFVKEFTLNTQAEYILDTENLEGDYVITPEGGSTVYTFSSGIGTESGSSPSSATIDGAAFEITPQNVNIGFQSDESAQEEIYLEADSARTGYNLLVEADGLDDDDVIDIFSTFGEFDNDNDGDDDGSVGAIVDVSDNGNSYNVDSDGVVFENVASDANITANFSDIETGDYEFEFEVTDTGVSDSSTVTVSEEDDVNAEILRGGVATAAQGDFAVLPIQLEETDEAYVNIGFNDVNFNATAYIEDGNDDGLVTLEVNSFLAGRNDERVAAFLFSDLTDSELGNTVPSTISGGPYGPGQTYDSRSDEVASKNPDWLANYSLDSSLTVADNEDDVSVDVTSSSLTGMRGLNQGSTNIGAADIGIDGPMEPDQYDVNVTSVSNEELDVGTIQIVEPQVSGINSWTMPGDVFSDVEEDETAEIYEFVENGELTQTNSVAEQDVLVFQIQSTSMFGALKATEDSTNDYSEAFDLITGYDDSQNFKFSVQQTEGSTAANLQEKELLLDDSTSNGVKVVPDERNSSLFVVMKEDNLALTRTELDEQSATELNNLNANLGMSDGEDYVANWTTFEDSDIGDDTQTVTDEASITEKSIEFDVDAGDVIRVAAAEGQTISGSTSVAPGTELNIRLRSTGDSPFLEDPEAVVDTNRTFSTTVDLSDRAQNASFSANAQGFDDDYDTPGVIGDAPTANVNFDDQAVSQDGTVEVSGTLSDGGFVSIRSGSADGEVIGATEYLSSGDFTEQVEVTPLSNESTLYAVAHMDTNDNEALDFTGPDSPDGPYMLNGSAVSDDATVSPAGMDDTPTTDEPVDTTEEPVDTTEEPVETTAAGTEPAETTTATGPGFTAVLALVALVAAALLAVRRRD